MFHKKSIALLLALLLITVGIHQVLPARGNAQVWLPIVSKPVFPLSGLSFEPFYSGLDAPTNITNAGDERLFVSVKSGVIYILDDEGLLFPTPFLDLTAQIDDSGDEMGLLGFTFHPEYTTNGYFFVYYTDLNGDTTVSRFSVSGDPNVADPMSETIIFTHIQPTPLHQAGALAFSPRDGYLYIAVGDGGSAASAQNTASLLGKILRLDVDSGLPYMIPPDNPFVGDATMLDEIWAMGLRNPWRITFDSQTGNLFIGDVGRGEWEEVNFQPAGSDGGENYGWPCYEGEERDNELDCESSEAYTFPIYAYSHENNNCSIIGGYVYRGNQYPKMQGHYIFTDFCSSRFYSLTPVYNETWRAAEVGYLPNARTTTFGEGVDGTLYLGNDAIYKVIPSES